MKKIDQCVEKVEYFLDKEDIANSTIYRFYVEQENVMYQIWVPKQITNKEEKIHWATFEKITFFDEEDYRYFDYKDRDDGNVNTPLWFKEILAQAEDIFEKNTRLRKLFMEREDCDEE